MTRSSAILAIVFLAAGCGTNQGQGSGSPAVRSSPEASTPPSSAAAAAIAFDEHEGGSLAAGTYSLPYASIAGRERFPTLAFEFTLEAGWEKVGIEGILWGERTKIGFAVPDAVYRDPCNPDAGLADQRIGSSLFALTGALSQLPGWDVDLVEWDRYLGFMGYHLELAAPKDLSDCEEPRPIMRIPGFPGVVEGWSEGSRQDFWILNVQGTTVVVFAVTDPEASEADRAALQAVFDSIRITP